MKGLPLFVFLEPEMIVHTVVIMVVVVNVAFVLLAAQDNLSEFLDVFFRWHFSTANC
jgi:hypothetical protein